MFQLTWKIMYPESYIQKSSGAFPALLSWIAKHCWRMRRHLCGPGDFVLIMVAFSSAHSSNGTSIRRLVGSLTSQTLMKLLFDERAASFCKIHVVIWNKKFRFCKVCWRNFKLQRFYAVAFRMRVVYFGSREIEGESKPPTRTIQEDVIDFNSQFYIQGS